MRNVEPGVRTNSAMMAPARDYVNLLSLIPSTSAVDRGSGVRGAQIRVGSYRAHLLLYQVGKGVSNLR